jgi:hypothetical protein
MLILVHTAHPQAVAHSGPGFGRLLSPRQFSRASDTAEAGIPWAADNDCFQRLDADAYKAMLDAIYGLPGCKFVVAPDVVGNWQATRQLYEDWYVELSAAWLPVAYVAQDGQPSTDVPWQGIDALFIGGTTEYKLSGEAERLAREARIRGLWVHMGRVNSRKRFDYARAIGCNSVDGSSFSRWRNRWLPNALLWHTDHLQERIPA